MTPTDFTQFQAESMKAANAFVAKSFEGFQKLSQLNTRVAQSAMEQSAEQVKSLMSAKDPKAMTELLSGNTPSAEVFSGYAKEAYEIAAQTNADVVSLIEEQVAEGNKKVDAAIDAMAKNAPAGTEGAINMIKQGLSVSRSAYEQASKATKQFAQTAEANVAAASKPAPKAGK
ncbi:MAG: TIGR01841 family phasin [Burkholderiaceae bacterium]